MEKESKIKNRNPYKVPDGYFDQLTENILEKAGSGSETKESRGKIVRLVRPALMLAAAMTGLVIITWVGLKLILPDNTLNINTEYAEISDYHLNEIDEMSIIELLLEEESTDDETYTDAEEEDSDIIEYLLDNNIDYSTILEQF